MPLNDFNFTIPEGLRNVTEYPSKPGSGTEAREQIQGRLDEVKTYLNNSVKVQVNANETNLSTHLAEDMQQAHLAKNVGIEDVAENFSATDVEGALSELFTSVSNGKDLIATAITDKGGSASGSDSFSDLAGEINDVASWDENLVAENIRAGKSIFGVSGVLSPRMYASGSTNTILKNIDGTNRWCIEVEGLSFTPTVIMFRKSGYSDSIARFGLYTSYFAATKCFFISSSISIVTHSGVVSTKNSTKPYVANGGFCLLANDGNENPCSWIAYG